MGRVGWSGSYRGGVGHAVKQPKNDSPQNQDLTQPKSFLEGVQIQVLNIKIIFISITVLYSQLYQKIIMRCSQYKKSQWHDYHISSKRKK